ncbi:hypothetical protein N431DRAFT_471437 [Stipitochalara longipes BDJ]|nr:hypothetical protein N431DRAFT_471437 [Stipitochalara longipes BDJ]
MESSETADERAARFQRRKVEHAEKERCRVNALNDKPTPMLTAETVVFKAREERNLESRKTKNSVWKFTSPTSEDPLSSLEELGLKEVNVPPTQNATPYFSSLTEDPQMDQGTNGTFSSANSEGGILMGGAMNSGSTRDRRLELACFSKPQKSTSKSFLKSHLPRIPKDSVNPTNLISFELLAQYARDSHLKSIGCAEMGTASMRDSHIPISISKRETPSSIINSDGFDGQNLEPTSSASFQNIPVYKTKLALKNRNITLRQRLEFFKDSSIVMICGDFEHAQALAEVGRQLDFQETCDLPSNYAMSPCPNASDIASLCTQSANAIQEMDAMSQQSQRPPFPLAKFHQATVLPKLPSTKAQPPYSIISQSIPIFDVSNFQTGTSPSMEAPKNLSSITHVSMGDTQQRISDIQRNNQKIGVDCSQSTATLANGTLEAELALTAIQNELKDKNDQIALLEKQRAILATQLKRERDDRYDEVKKLKTLNKNITQALTTQATTNNSLAKEQQHDTKKIDNIYSQLFVTLQDKEILKSIFITERQESANEIAELQQTLAQNAFDRDISETDIRDSYQACLEEFHETLAESNEDRQNKSKKIDQLQAKTLQTARDNIHLVEQLATEKKERGEILDKERFAMQEDFQEDRTRMREILKDERARMKGKINEERVRMGEQMNDERALEKPRQAEINDLEIRLNSALQRIDSLSRQLKDERENNISTGNAVEADLVLIQKAQKAAEEIRKKALEEVEALTAELSAARQYQQSFHTLEKQHQVVLNNMNALQSNLQQVCQENISLEHKLEQNKQKSSQGNTETESKLQNALDMFASVGQAFKKEKEAK